MKHAGTKILSMLLCVTMLLSAAACGSGKESAELDGDQVKSDVQEYLKSFVDADAEITSVNQSQNKISQTQTEAICQVAYTTDGSDATCVMTMLYEQNDGAWSLIQCDAQFGEAEATSAAQTEDAAPLENSAEATTDADTDATADEASDYATITELKFSSITEAEAMESLKQYQGAPMLQTLRFTDMTITDELLGYLFGSGYSANPLKLCFEQCTIDAKEQSTYTGNITQLTIHDCALSDEPKWINQVTTITKLAVTNTEDTDYSFNTLHLSRLDSLEELDLTGTYLNITLSEAVLYPETPEPFVYHVDATLSHAKERGTYNELINLGVAAGSYPLNCDFVFPDGETINPSL